MRVLTSFYLTEISAQRPATRPSSSSSSSSSSFFVFSSVFVYSVRDVISNVSHRINDKFGDEKRKREEREDKRDKGSGDERERERERDRV